MDILVHDIEWDTDGAAVDLPKEVKLNTAAEGIDKPGEEVADWLADRYGWCVTSFKYKPVSV